MDPTFTPLALGPDLTIASAAALRTRLLAALATATPLHLDLSAVEEIDSAGVQLLLAARRSLQASGRTWRVSAAPAVVVQTLAVLGLSVADLGPQA